MRIFLTNQQEHLLHWLPDFKRLPLSYDLQTVLQEQVSRMVVSTKAAEADLSAYNFDFLFAYDIFPHRILSFASEWQAYGRPMQVGDVIVQQAFLPPLGVSLKCVFAVKVLEMVREPTKVGFSYGTLRGHAEIGRSEFAFERRNGVLQVTIHTHSAPGFLLTRLVAPLITLPYQRYCTHQALQRMRSAFLMANPRSA